VLEQATKRKSRRRAGSALESSATPFLQASLALSKRWWWQLKRTPLEVVVALAQPALWLVLFGNLFAKSGVVTGTSYIAFMTAGVVIMTVFNAALNGGAQILFDRETGMLHRLLAAPIPPGAILWSRFVYVLGLTSFQALVIILVASLLGVRIASGVTGLVLILATGILLGVGITALSMALAFTFKHHGQWFSVIGFVSLPLLFASNALAPFEAMPGWLQVLTRFNPMTYAISAARQLILEGFDLVVIASMAAALLSFDVVMILLALAAMRRALE
jgi:ABC-2 type transport system permease protein